MSYVQIQNPICNKSNIEKGNRGRTQLTEDNCCVRVRIQNGPKHITPPSKKHEEFKELNLGLPCDRRVYSTTMLRRRRPDP